MVYRRNTTLPASFYCVKGKVSQCSHLQPKSRNSKLTDLNTLRTLQSVFKSVNSLPSWLTSYKQPCSIRDVPDGLLGRLANLQAESVRRRESTTLCGTGTEKTAPKRGEFRSNAWRSKCGCIFSG